MRKPIVRSFLSSLSLLFVLYSHGQAQAFQNVGRSQSSELFYLQQPQLGGMKVLGMMPHFECATAAGMAGLGDLLAQLRHIRQSRDPTEVIIDWKRTAQFMLKGFGEGFLWSVWYRRAEIWSSTVTSLLTNEATNPFMTTFVGTAVSLILDLTIACPIIYGFWDIPFPLYIRGKFRDIPKRIHSKLGEMLAASIKVWTPVNIVIYNAPVQYRVYLMSFADVFWQSIVSSITTPTTSINDEDEFLKPVADPNPT